MPHRCHRPCPAATRSRDQSVGRPAHVLPEPSGLARSPRADHSDAERGRRRNCPHLHRSRPLQVRERPLRPRSRGQAPGSGRATPTRHRTGLRQHRPVRRRRVPRDLSSRRELGSGGGDRRACRGGDEDHHRRRAGRDRTADQRRGRLEHRTARRRHLHRAGRQRHVPIETKTRQRSHTLHSRHRRGQPRRPCVRPESAAPPRAEAQPAGGPAVSRS